MAEINEGKSGWVVDPPTLVEDGTFEIDICCNQCNGVAQELHVCPFASEIHDDATLCNCCEHCEHECARDI